MTACGYVLRCGALVQVRHLGGDGPVSVDGEGLGVVREAAKRGCIGGFSRGSQLRFIRLCESVREREQPVFLTLTYPASEVEVARQCKVHMERFRKRLDRAWPGCRGLWKLELTKRMVPHFHLLLWGIGDLLRFRMWALEAWADVVGIGGAHRRAGISAEWARSRRKTTFYMAKELGKSAKYAGEWNLGRAWGCIFRKRLALADEVQVAMLDEKGFEAARCWVSECNRVHMGVSREKWEEWRARRWFLVRDPDAAITDLAGALECAGSARPEWHEVSVDW